MKANLMHIDLVCFAAYKVYYMKGGEEGRHEEGGRGREEWKRGREVERGRKGRRGGR